MRHFSNQNFLEILQIDADTEQVTIGAQRADLVKSILVQFEAVKRDERLLKIPFTTLTDYLYM